MQYKGMKKHTILGVLLATGIIAFPLWAGGISAPPALTQPVADSLYVNVTGDTVTGNFAVDGDTTLGDAIGDTVTVNAGIVDYDSDFAANFIQDAIYTAKGFIRFVAQTEIEGNFEAQGATELGDNVADTVTIKAGTVTHPNATTINYDATTIFDALGQSFSFKGAWTIIGSEGVTLDPAGDVDTWLFRVLSTGNPAFSWVDGATDRFVLTHNLTLPDATTATDALNRQTGDARYAGITHATEHEVGGGDLITHDNLTGAGTKTHAQIDTHLGSTSNPHTVTAAQVSAIPTSEKGAANGVASLSAGSLVVQDPANATATPTADKIVKADGSGLVDGWVTYNPGGTDIPITDGGTGESTAALGFSALSPLATNGDLLGYSTTDVRVPVGADGKVLTADSGEIPGVKWAARSPIVVMLGGGTDPYFSTSNAAYTTAGVFLFGGTDDLGLLTSIEAIGFKEANPTSWDWRLLDITNATTIAEVTGNTGTAPEISTDGTPTNLPAAQAMFEFQVRRAGGIVADNVFVHSATIEF